MRSSGVAVPTAVMALLIAFRTLVDFVVMRVVAAAVSAPVVKLETLVSRLSRAWWIISIWERKISFWARVRPERTKRASVNCILEGWIVLVCDILLAKALEDRC